MRKLMKKLLLQRETEEDTPMANPPPYPDSNSDTGDDTTPRWVKVFGIIALVLVLLFVILHLTGRGLGGHTPPSSVTEHGVKRP